MRMTERLVKEYLGRLLCNCLEANCTIEHILYFIEFYTCIKGGDLANKVFNKDVFKNASWDIKKKLIYLTYYSKVGALEVLASEIIKASMSNLFERIESPDELDAIVKALILSFAPASLVEYYIRRAPNAELLAEPLVLAAAAKGLGLSPNLSAYDILKRFVLMNEVPETRRKLLSFILRQYIEGQGREALKEQLQRESPAFLSIVLKEGEDALDKDLKEVVVQSLAANSKHKMVPTTGGTVSQALEKIGEKTLHVIETIKQSAAVPLQAVESLPKRIFSTSAPLTEDIGRLHGRALYEAGLKRGGLPSKEKEALLMRLSGRLAYEAIFNWPDIGRDARVACLKQRLKGRLRFEALSKGRGWRLPVDEIMAMLQEDAPHLRHLTPQEVQSLEHLIGREQLFSLLPLLADEVVDELASKRGDIPVDVLLGIFRRRVESLDARAVTQALCRWRGAPAEWWAEAQERRLLLPIAAKEAISAQGDASPFNLLVVKVGSRWDKEKIMSLLHVLGDDYAEFAALALIGQADHLSDNNLLHAILSKWSGRMSDVAYACQDSLSNNMLAGITRTLQVPTMDYIDKAAERLQITDREALEAMVYLIEGKINDWVGKPFPLPAPRLWEAYPYTKAAKAERLQLEQGNENGARNNDRYAIFYPKFVKSPRSV